MNRRIDALTILLAMTTLGMAALLWFAFTQPIDTRPVADTGASGSVTADVASARPARPGPIADYRETLNRPLFEPSRRPMAPKPTEATQPSVVPPIAKAPPPVATPVSLTGLKLLGVVKTGAEPIRALVRAGDGETGQWVTVGAQLGRWRIETISEGAVVLEAQGTRVELAMFAAPRVLAKR